MRPRGCAATQGRSARLPGGWSVRPGLRDTGKFSEQCRLFVLERGDLSSAPLLVQYPLISGVVALSRSASIGETALQPFQFSCTVPSEATPSAPYSSRYPANR